MFSSVVHRRVMKYLLKRSEVERVLTVSCMFSVLLLVIKIVCTNSIEFAFLIWNLFLAVVPFLITSIIKSKQTLVQHRIKFLLIFCCWVIFIPNTFYIITDLFHLHWSKAEPRWFELTLILSFGWNGIMIGILSIRDMQALFMSRFKVKQAIFFLYPVMWLIAWGVYIGRFLRFNSWDVVTDPFTLMKGITGMMIHPFRNLYAWGMIGCFAVFMTMIYLSFTAMKNNLKSEG